MPWSTIIDSHPVRISEAKLRVNGVCSRCRDLPKRSWILDILHRDDARDQKRSLLTQELRPTLNEELCLCSYGELKESYLSGCHLCALLRDSLRQCWETNNHSEEPAPDTMVELIVRVRPLVTSDRTKEIFKDFNTHLLPQSLSATISPYFSSTPNLLGESIHVPPDDSESVPQYQTLGNQLTTANVEQIRIIH
jgi:hypothetical protein